MQQNVTEGPLMRALVRFSVPYLLASFLQTFYGLADLLITGWFYEKNVQAAVSIGSQVMHMVTVVTIGLSVGSTVMIARAVGAKREKEIETAIGNSILIFAVISVAATILLMAFRLGILRVLATPPEAFKPAAAYLRICFAGVPFIIAYNLISSIFRGLGDTRTPLILVAFSGLINIGLDLLLIGGLRMGAAGAALATITAQGASVIMALIVLRRMKIFRVTRGCLKPDRGMESKILHVGAPIAVQEGLIQVSFLVITAVANNRGVVISDAVGIVEKIITFLFLVPSAMMATVSAMAAQNAGAGKHDRSEKILRSAVVICVGFGLCCIAITEPTARFWIALFQRKDEAVIAMGAQYLRAYIFDCAIAGIHFCYSGFFSAYGRSVYSFIQNMTSALFVRIPLVFLFTAAFPNTLFPMGLATPIGSAVSVVICLLFYRNGKKKRLFY